MEKYKIVTSANEPFVPYAKTWLASIRQNMSIASPFIRFVNCDVVLGCDREVVTKRFKEAKLEKFYCAHVKPSMLMQDAEYVMWLDADSVVLKDCTELIKYLTRFDFAASCKKSGRFNAFFLWVKTSELMTEFLQDYDWWVKKYEKRKKTRWTADQDALNHIMPKWKKRLVFKSIPHKLVSWRASSKTIIWNAKGGVSRQSKAFTAARKKFL